MSSSSNELFHQVPGAPCDACRAGGGTARKPRCTPAGPSIFRACKQPSPCRRRRATGGGCAGGRRRGGAGRSRRATPAGSLRFGEFYRAITFQNRPSRQVFQGRHLIMSLFTIKIPKAGIGNRAMPASVAAVAADHRKPAGRACKGREGKTPARLTGIIAVSRSIVLSNPDDSPNLGVPTCPTSLRRRNR